MCKLFVSDVAYCLAVPGQPASFARRSPPLRPIRRHAPLATHFEPVRIAGLLLEGVAIAI
jgi:hypothetical protein